jgi:hypothetical protein
MNGESRNFPTSYHSPHHAHTHNKAIYFCCFVTTPHAAIMTLATATSTTNAYEVRQSGKKWVERVKKWYEGLNRTNEWTNEQTNERNKSLYIWCCWYSDTRGIGQRKRAKSRYYACTHASAESLEEWVKWRTQRQRA